jgi:hypothetical protein
MKVPNVTFSHWTKWDEHTSLNGGQFPGVYLLAHFVVTPVGKAKPQAKQIVYIGETCNNSLIGRLRQFNRSAFQGKSGHSGGSTYRQAFGCLGSNLYVAVFPVKGLNKELCSLFIRYVERKLIWEFGRKWGDAPKCNHI